MISEGLSFIGFDFMDVEGQRLIPVVPYESKMLSIAAQLIKNPLEATQELFSNYGDSCQVLFPTGKRYLFTSDPEIMEHILISTDSKSHSYVKGDSMVHGANSVFGSDNIIIGSGDAWRTRRSAMASEFGHSQFENAKAIQSIDSAVMRAVRDLHSRVEQSGGNLEIDLQQEFARTTLAVFLNSFFSIDQFTFQELDEVTDALTTLLDSFPAEALNMLPLSLVDLDEIFPPLSNLAESRAVLNAFAEKIIEIGRQRTEPRGDLLDILVNARDKNSGELLEHKSLLDEIKTMIVTGHETTGRTLAFSLGSIVANQNEFSRVIEEVRAQKGTDFENTKSLTDAFPVLAQNQSEALRMYPSFYTLPRQAIKQDRIETKTGPVIIHKGTAIMLSPFHMQRREDIFGENITGYSASTYAPQRWEPENLKAHNLEAHDLPIETFGHGARVCLGRFFFNPEFLIVMRRYLENFSFDALNTDIESELVGTFGLKCEKGIRVMLRNNTA
jgi:cytochrome P450